MPRSHPQTAAADGVVIERKFYEADSAYAESVMVWRDSVQQAAGEVEPTLAEPIDYDAELALRRQTHEPIDFDPDADLTNTAFGI